MTNDKTNTEVTPLSIALHWAEEYRHRSDKGEVLHGYERSAVVMADEIAWLRAELSGTVEHNNAAVRLAHERGVEIAKLRQLTSTVPLQPVVKVSGVVRFQANNIVRFLFDNSTINLHRLAQLRYLFSQTDWDQFYQLIGYSVSGYSDMEVSRESVQEADRRAEALVGS